MPRLLLLSNSRSPGLGYLEHALAPLAAFLGNGVRQVAFIPWAAVTEGHDEYVARVREVFGALGVAVRSVHDGDASAIVEGADAIVVGGGNTFQLLARMHYSGLLDRVRTRVRAGVPYVGWSAGSNLACPSIRTTNDMPIVQPPSFAALELVPFQINPHYTDQVIPGHGAESRDDRIAEFLALNSGVRVVGLREGSLLRREGDRMTLLGPHPLRLFAAGTPAEEVPPGDVSQSLLA